MVSEMKGPLFPNFGSGASATWNAADTSLWFFWTLQQYADATGDKGAVWKDYGKRMKAILDGYHSGTEFNIHMDTDGLIDATQHGVALTWMDAVANGKPVTPRMGKTVEINALWYNAICFATELAKEAGDAAFCKKWEVIAEQVKISFVEKFWSPERRYLADYIDGAYVDWAVRPNMVIATSLPYSPVSEEIRKEVLSRVKQELLTTRGLRTLTPKSPIYKGIYYGNQAEREAAYHQGSVSPWLLGHFVEGYLKIHGKSGMSLIKSLYEGFEAVMTEHGIGTISELYDGDPPHVGRGAISQASSVAELLRIGYLIKKFS
jgi:predicted glycogen debranching enzyme